MTQKKTGKFVAHREKMVARIKDEKSLIVQHRTKWLMDNIKIDRDITMALEIVRVAARSGDDIADLCSALEQVEAYNDLDALGGG